MLIQSWYRHGQPKHRKLVELVLWRHIATRNVEVLLAPRGRGAWLNRASTEETKLHAMCIFLRFVVRGFMPRLIRSTG